MICVSKAIKSRVGKARILLGLRVPEACLIRRRLEGGHNVKDAWMTRWRKLGISALYAEEGEDGCSFIEFHLIRTRFHPSIDIDSSLCFPNGPDYTSECTDHFDVPFA